MINQVYQLTSPRQFEVTYNNVDIYSDNVVVRPLYLSICAADQRYYTGSRDEQTLKKKLPMALIHEGVGEVVFDSKGIYEKGTKVVMVPNTPREKDSVIAENYLPSSYFKSSGYDGFMQDFLFFNHDRIVTLPENIDLSTISYTELVSVSLHAVSRFENKSISNRKTEYKLSHFSFVDKTFYIDSIPENLTFDHAFECVGGKGSQSAINQMIDYIYPEGSIALLGVSEMPVEINTRLVLEKGITLIGSSRSGTKDFQNVVDLYMKYPDILEKLSLLKGEEFEIRTINDLIHAFEYDLSTSWGKTVLKWIL